MNTTDRKSVRAFELFLVAAGITLLLISPHVPFSDGAERLSALGSLLHGQVRPTHFSYLGSFTALPLWAIGSFLGAGLAWAEYSNLLVFIVGTGLLVMTLGAVCSIRLLRLFILVLLGGSMFPYHVRAFGGEVFTAMCVSVGLALVYCRGITTASVLLGLGVVNTPATIGGAVLVIVKQIWENRRLRYLAIIAGALVLIALESYLKFGSCLKIGYEHDAGYPTVLPFSGRPGFSYPLLFGVLSLLFSFGKGIIFFAPGILLPLRRFVTDGRLVAWHTTLLLFVGGLVLVYAKWWSWYGGWSWGPRFLLITSIPASFALAAALLATRSFARDCVVAVVLTLSFLVGLNAYVFEMNQVNLCSQGKYALESLCWYTPEFSGVFRILSLPLNLSPQRMYAVIYVGLVYLYLAVPLFLAIASDAWRRSAAFRTQVFQLRW
jgi:hypothetical protein